MGVYLSKPQTAKESFDGGCGNGLTSYGISSMQGWRKQMEDAFLAQPMVDEHDMSIYGVFDGHGGPAVSCWVSRHFMTVFKDNLIKIKERLEKLEIDINEVPPVYVTDFKADIRAFLGEDDDNVIPDEEETTVNSKDLSINTIAVCEAMQRSFLEVDELMKLDETRDELRELHNSVYTDGDREEGDNMKTGIQHIVQCYLTGRKNGMVVSVIDDKTEKEEELFDFNDKDDENTDLGDIKQPEDTEDAETMEDEQSLRNVMSPHQPECCGSTAIVVSFMRDEQGIKCVTANAGDSRGVLCRNGIAVPLSVDHKPNMCRETERIKSAGGRVTQGRVDGNLNLSRSMGDLAYKVDEALPPERQRITSFPDIRVTELTDKDEFCILACDGIWDCISNQQLVELVRPYVRKIAYGIDLVEEEDHLHMEEKWEKLSQICEAVCDRCLAASPGSNDGLGCDNMTMMIVVFNHESCKAKTLDDTNGPRLYTGRLYRHVKAESLQDHKSPVLSSSENMNIL